MITNEFTVWCEVEGERCVHWHQVSVGVGGTKMRAIDEFRRVGWKIKNGKWVCPVCQKLQK